MNWKLADLQKLLKEGATVTAYVDGREEIRRIVHFQVFQEGIYAMPYIEMWEFRAHIDENGIWHIMSDQEG